MTVFDPKQIQEQEELVDETEEAITKSIHDYWSHHPYYRMSVQDLIEEFCGWGALVELVNFKPNTELERAFLSALFLTGGRIQEVLSLRRESFSVHERKDGEKYLQVKNMMLEKRYRKIGAKFVGSDGRNHFKTEKLFKYRNQFAIMLKEPLADILLNWINKCQGEFLFPSPRKKKGTHKKIERCLSRHWAYRFIRFLDKTIPTDLKASLGLDKPFIVNRTNENPEGEQIADQLHLWLHFFRAMRASQLVQDYDWKIDKLMHYFSWLDVKVALRYMKTSAKNFADSMDTESYE